MFKFYSHIHHTHTDAHTHTERQTDEKENSIVAVNKPPQTLATAIVMTMHGFN